MNLHIGSWIVPLLFMLGYFVWTLHFIRTKVIDKLTWADAQRAKWDSVDKLVQAAVAFVLIGKWGLYSLIVWLVWIIVSPLLK